MKRKRRREREEEFHKANCVANEESSKGRRRRIFTKTNC
jgi:hypothetical protein